MYNSHKNISRHVISLFLFFSFLFSPLILEIVHDHKIIDQDCEICLISGFSIISDDQEYSVINETLRYHFVFTSPVNVSRQLELPLATGPPFFAG